MATVATISVNFAQYNATSFNTPGVIDRSINPSTLSQYCLGSSTPDFNYLGGFVKKTADTMSGYLTLPSTDPTLPDHASRKGYVDSRIDSLSSTVSDLGGDGFVKIKGSTMTGPLTLNTLTQTLALHATSKSYVDTKVSDLNTTIGTNLTNNFLAKAGGTMSGIIDMGSQKITFLANPVVATDAANKTYVDKAVSDATTGGASIAYVNQQDALNVLKAGSTMSGPLILNADPTVPLGATTKQYVDSVKTTANTAVTNAATAKTTADTAVTAAAAAQTTANTAVANAATAQTTANTAVANAATAQTAADNANANANTRLPKSGGTIDGNLTIQNGSPTLHLQDTDQMSAMIHCNSNLLYFLRGAANSTVWAQVNGQWPLYINLTNNDATFGGNITTVGNIACNALTLNGVITDPMQAATKKYVDSTVGSGTAGGATIVYVNQQDALNVLKAGSTMSGPLHIAGSEGIIGSNSGGLGARIDVQSQGSGATSNAAYMTFHRPGVHAVKFGLDTDRKLKVGGWSMGNVAYEILDQSNWGTYIQPAINVASAAAATAQGTADTAKTTADAANTNANTRLPSTGGTIEGNLSLRNGSPTLYLQDTDARSAMIHCNSDKLYFLRGAGIDSAIWEPIAGRWPLVLDLTNNEATFGGNITTANNITCDYLTLNGAIVDSLQAATKEYVDSTVGSGTAGGATIKYVDGKNALNVLKEGSTMSGPLILNADPIAPLAATTKQYVDSVKTTANTAVTNAAAAKTTADTAVTAAATAKTTADTAVTAAAAAQTAANTAKTTADAANTNANTRVLQTAPTMSGNLIIRNSAPTIIFQDTDDLSSMIHCENNLLQFLRGEKNSPAWTQINGAWPLTLNLTNNNANFGGAIIAVGDVTAFSDERIKENIKTIEEPLDKVLKMRGVSYNRSDEYGEKGRLHVGVIAQEIEKILPEVVSENDKGMKNVAYGNIVGVLIEAIKELNAKIEKLEAKN